MKKSWPTKKLGDVCPISNRKPETFIGKRPYFSTGVVGPEGELSEPEIVDFANRPSRAGCMPIVGDIGFARMKGTKKVILIDDSLKGSLFSTGFCFIAPKPNVDPRFAFYFVMSEYFQEAKNALAGDGIMGGVKNSDAAAIEMPLPPLAEQKRIVGLLDEAFAGLATAQAHAEKNHRNARALFESHLQSVFTQRGNGWKQKTLAELCEPSRVITYGVIKLGDETPSGVPCLRTSNVRWLRIETDGMKRITPKLSAEYSRTILKGGEVLVNVRGTLGGVAVASPEMAGWNVSREVAVVPIDSRRIKPKFVSYLIGSGESQQWLGGVKKGAAYVGINIEDLRLLPVGTPHMTEQQEIVGHLDSFHEETQRLDKLYERKRATLAALKQSLLHQAFTGNL